MNKLLLRCALLLSLFAAPLAMSDDHSTVIIADKNGVTAVELATTDGRGTQPDCRKPQRQRRLRLRGASARLWHCGRAERRMGRNWMTASAKRSKQRCARCAMASPLN